MRQEQFVARYQREWQAFEHWLETRGDARKVLISLTATGRNLVNKPPDGAQTRLVSALSEMTRSDLKSLANQLNALIGIMDMQQQVDASGLARPRMASRSRVLRRPISAA